MNLKKIFAVSIAGLLTVFILFGCTALQQASDTTEDVTTSLHFVDYTRQGDGNGAGDGVTISSMNDGYVKRTYVGARRILN